MDQLGLVQDLNSDLIRAIEKPVSPKNYLQLSWKNHLAIERVDQLYQNLGKPNYLHSEEGGSLSWIVPYLGSEIRIVTRDQKVPHLIPAPHLDFLYLYLKIWMLAPRFARRKRDPY